jgi:hypothetical protein
MPIAKAVRTARPVYIYVTSLSESTVVPNVFHPRSLTVRVQLILTNFCLSRQLRSSRFEGQTSLP